MALQGLYFESKSQEKQRNFQQGPYGIERTFMIMYISESSNLEGNEVQGVSRYFRKYPKFNNFPHIYRHSHGP